MNSIDLGYEYKDISHLERALTHSSYANDNNVLSYERLEFLGDALLELSVSQIIYNITTLNEGQLTKLRAKLVSESYLQNVCDNLKLTKKIKLGKSITKISNSIKADVVESVIASIYLDSSNDFNEVLNFVNKYIIINEDNINLIYSNTIDFKTLLQEKLGAKAIIKYNLKKKSGPEHNPIFEVEVVINDKVIAKAKGKTLKNAEQQCAKIALEEYEIEV